MRTIVFFLLISVASTLAAEGDGGYAGAFLRMGIGARAKALGDAHTAVADGAVAAFYNPAVMPHFQERQVALSYAFLPLDRNLNYIGFAMPLQPNITSESGAQPLRAGVSVGWVNAGVSNIDGRDSAGNHTRDYSHSENAFYMSFALQPADHFSIGLSGKVLRNSMPNMTMEDEALVSQGFGMDLGIYYRPLPGLSLGAAVRDLLSKYTWNTDKVFDRGTSTTYEFPKVIRVGAAYRLPREWLLLSVDVETSDKQDTRIHAGAEWTYEQVGALRLGWDHDTITAGLGLYFEIFERTTTVNYAFIPGIQSLSADHIISWTFSF